LLNDVPKIKNHKASTTKALLSLAPYFKYRMVMSGTPAPNEETEYWSQMTFVNAMIFGTSFNKFRNTYFHLEVRGVPIQTNGMIMTRQAMAEIFKRGARYETTPDKRKALFDRMSPWLHSAKKEECLDLPEQIDEIRYVDMVNDQMKSYEELRVHLVTEIKDQKIAAPIALTKIMKLREVASGFLVDEEGKSIDFSGCPKLKALEDLMDELGNRQAIIWCQFVWEVGRVTALCVDRQATFATLYSGTKNKEDSIDGFISGKYQYMIAHPRSAAHGLTFVNCSHQIFFSLDYSWESYEQARARTHRAGQKNTCIYYHIMAKNTLEPMILDVLRKKGDAQEILFQLTLDTGQ